LRRWKRVWVGGCPQDASRVRRSLRCLYIPETLKKTKV
jgi:hypothetical protein